MTRAKTPERPTPSAAPIPSGDDDAPTPAAPVKADKGASRRRILSGRLIRFFIILAVGAVAVTVIDEPFSVNSGVEAGVPPGTVLTSSGSLIVREDGTVIDGLHVEGRIWIRADDVTIRNTRVSYRGYHSIRVMPGYRNATIEHVDIECGSSRTNGIVFGNFTATAVATTGCRNGFVTTGGNLSITDSLVDGEPFELTLGRPPARPSTTTTVPPTTAPPTTAPAPTTTTAPPAEAPPTTAPADPPPSGGRPSGGFPDASTTGPSGDLQASGSITADQDGQVIENLHVQGTITVNASNVTIRNTLVDSNDTYPIRIQGATNLVVEDSEIDGNGVASVAILHGEYTLRRVDIHDVRDGPRIEGDNVRIEDSYIHHLTRVPDGHHDAIQIRSGVGIDIVGNTIEAWNASTGDPMNAAIQIGSLNGPLDDLTVENNYMDGGNYTINAVKSAGTSIFRNNVFGPNARYGTLADGPGVTFDGSNVMQSGGPA
jgi:hypothetical protein